MRLLTFDAAGQPRLGAEWNGRIVDLQNAAALMALTREGADAAAAAVRRLPSDMLGFLRAGEEARALATEALRFLEQIPEPLRDSLAAGSALLHSPAAVRRLAPIPRPGKIICIGLNYRDHAAESGMAVPSEPVVFCKYSNAVIGPEAPILLPPTSEQVDYEAELVFVVGRTARHVPAARAMDYVAGYTCGHDVSARDYQLRRGGGQWNIGKTFDTFAPMGPVLVTADEPIDPHALPIRCVVNGETLQNSNTCQFIFTIPQLVEYLSHVMTLEPGDVVFTGTPPGVGFARKPPIFLKDGDVVEIQIDGIGVLRNPVRAG